jgi:hypothetical protein
VEPAHPRPPAEQVGGAPLELSGAAAGENDAQVAVAVEQELYLVEQQRQLLDLVHHQDALSGVERLPQGLGTCAQLAERVGLEQVVAGRVRQGGADERALAGLARAEEEHRPVPEQLGEIQEAGVHQRHCR